MEDWEIIALYWRRDEAAIRESDRKFGRMLRRIAWNILISREDSEECVNDTYGKAWDAMPPDKPGFLSAYLGRLIRNVSINRWQANHAKKRGGGADVLLSELSDCIPAAHTVEQTIEAKALADIISRWLYTLTQDDRVLFLRRYWFGDSLTALAFEHATMPAKLAGRLYRLRQKLKGALEQEGVIL